MVYTLKTPFTWLKMNMSKCITFLKHPHPQCMCVGSFTTHLMSQNQARTKHSDLMWAQGSFPPSADECENSLLVSNSAHTSLCTVKPKHHSEVIRCKTHFWVEGDLKYCLNVSLPHFYVGLLADHNNSCLQQTQLSLFLCPAWSSKTRIQCEPCSCVGLLVSKHFTEALGWPSEDKWISSCDPSYGNQMLYSHKITHQSLQN